MAGCPAVLRATLHQKELFLNSLFLHRKRNGGLPDPVEGHQAAQPADQRGKKPDPAGQDDKKTAQKHSAQGKNHRGQQRDGAQPPEPSTSPSRRAWARAGWTARARAYSSTTASALSAARTTTSSPCRPRPRPRTVRRSSRAPSTPPSPTRPPAPRPWPLPLCLLRRPLRRLRLLSLRLCRPLRRCCR